MSICPGKWTARTISVVWNEHFKEAGEPPPEPAGLQNENLQKRGKDLGIWRKKRG